MLKKLFLVLTVLTFLGTLLSCTQSQAENVDLPTTSHPAIDAYNGWHLGMQAWSFNRYTFLQALEKTASLGLSWIEGYPGQRLGEAYPDVKFDPSLSPELRAMVKSRMKELGIRFSAFGVVGLPNNEAESRKVFDFAKDMGIPVIVSEPPEDAFDLVEKLCEEYQIKMAIHNHPKPSHYWNPATVLKVVKGRSKLLGSSADIGHWMRSGINPLDALKMLKGRIVHSHFKDLNEFGVREAHDVPWGTGKADVPALLAELQKQGYQGAFSIEYEYHWESSMPEIRQSVEYFNKEAAKLNPTGWKNLFAKDLSNTILKKAGSWTFGDDGVLTLNGGGDIWTKARYGDFILDLEYKLEPETNSGVFIRCGSLKDFVQTAIEVQIHETTDGAVHGENGAIYNCLSPGKNVEKKAGEWNRYTITARGNKIYVVLNGEQIIDMDLDRWTEAHKNPDGTKNKFNTPLKDFPREGHIGLQDHHHPIWFRNIRIKEL